MDELDQLFSVLRKPTFTEICKIIVDADRKCPYGLVSPAAVDQLLRDNYWTTDEWDSSFNAE
jgi:hypothetical protein